MSDTGGQHAQSLGRLLLRIQAGSRQTRQNHRKSCAKVARDLGLPAHDVVRWRQLPEKQEQVAQRSLDAAMPHSVLRKSVSKRANENWKSLARSGTAKKALGCLEENSTLMGLARFLAKQP